MIAQGPYGTSGVTTKTFGTFSDWLSSTTTAPPEVDSFRDWLGGQSRGKSEFDDFLGGQPLDRGPPRLGRDALRKLEQRAESAARKAGRRFWMLSPAELLAGAIVDELAWYGGQWFSPEAGDPDELPNIPGFTLVCDMRGSPNCSDVYGGGSGPWRWSGQVGWPTRPCGDVAYQCNNWGDPFTMYKTPQEVGETTQLSGMLDHAVPAAASVRAIWVSPLPQIAYLAGTCVLPGRQLTARPDVDPDQRRERETKPKLGTMERALLDAEQLPLKPYQVPVAVFEPQPYPWPRTQRGGGGGWTPGTHDRLPDKKDKFRMRYVLGSFFGALTEVSDALDCFTKAQGLDRFSRNQGMGHKLMMAFQHLPDTDLGQLNDCMQQALLEDAVIGAANRIAARALVNSGLWRSPVVGLNFRSWGRDLGGPQNVQHRVKKHSFHPTKRSRRPRRGGRTQWAHAPRHSRSWWTWRDER